MFVTEKLDPENSKRKLDACSQCLPGIDRPRSLTLDDCALQKANAVSKLLISKS